MESTRFQFRRKKNGHFEESKGILWTSEKNSPSELAIRLLPLHSGGSVFFSWASATEKAPTSLTHHCLGAALVGAVHVRVLGLEY
jgi:hypothetical protein